MAKRIPWDTVKQDIYNNHNHSWYQEVWNRNKNNLSKPAISFRGNATITYREFFQLTERYARALRSYGIGIGDEFVTCLRLTPDYPLLIAAASLMNSKINLAAPFFNEDFFCEVVESAGSKIVLVTDWDFVQVAPALKRCTEGKTIVVLRVDEWDKDDNPNKAIIDRFVTFSESEFQKAVSEFDNVIFTEEFLEHGELFNGEVDGHGSLADEMAITYTSGTSSPGRHKAVAQRNETYIIMGRFHDAEVSGMPPMDKLVTQSSIGAQADTTLMTCISDPLIQTGTIALDPIIDKDYFPYSLKINKAGLVVATRSFWMHALKTAYSDPEFKNYTLPYLYVPSEGGEPLSVGEEKALNRWLKRINAGVKNTHTLFSVSKMSIGGGDTEHGNLFLRLFRGYYDIIQKLRGINEPIGMECYKFAEIQSLRDDGTYCEPMELGHLVANSPISMSQYYKNPDATKGYFITDAYGKDWGDLFVYGYLDKWGNVYMKGRISADDPKVKTFEVAEAICRDYKNILSCEVVTVEHEQQTVYVAHIEPQFEYKVDLFEAVKIMRETCRKEFGETFLDTLYIRWHTFEEGYPVLSTTKRNVRALKDEGIGKAIKL